MIYENKSTNDGNGSSTEQMTFRFFDPMLYDRLHTLSVEYSLPVELLINVAVKRLTDDVDFVRSLRLGEINRE